MNLLGRLRDRWVETPLSRRMVVLIIMILTTALAIVGTIMIGILQRHLFSQVNTQLLSSAQQLAENVSNDRDMSGTPTSFFIKRDVEGKPPKVIITPATKKRAGEPIVDGILEIGDLPLTQNNMTVPITVNSTKPGATWRVVAIPMASNGAPVGVVIVGLPLVDVSETIINTTLSFFLAGIGIIILSSLTGYYLVSRSLRPLRQIETVAGKIAGGDLSQRIPPAAPATEVGSLALSLNAMLAQIESSLTARDESEQKVRRFVSDASHELRTPLAAIKGYGELYRMGAVPEEKIGDVMGRIESESTRMGTLVEDLLVLARLDERRPLSKTEVDLVRLAKDAQSDLEALDPTRPIRLNGLTQRKPPASLLVKADRDQLTQVIVNLVGNINRYTPPSSPVEILVGQDDQWAVIELRDHGPGIDPEDQDRVFERFYRTDQSRARSLGGSGLGLSIVGGIVDAHEGTVQLSSTPKGGLTVRVQLPLPTEPSAE